MEFTNKVNKATQMYFGKGMQQDTACPKISCQSLLDADFFTCDSPNVRVGGNKEGRGGEYHVKHEKERHCGE